MTYVGNADSPRPGAPAQPGKLASGGSRTGRASTAMCLASRRSFSRRAELSARVHEHAPYGRLASLGPGVPAESPDRDKAARYSPDRQDQQLAAR